MAALRFGAATDPGRIRAQNEDNVLAEPGLFVVADGMGGHRAGEVASALAIDLLRSRLGREAIGLDDVVAAMADANADIYRAAVGNPDQHGMGTTVTALVVIADDTPEGEERSESFALVNVGDSRTYLLRHGRLRRVTVDHSYVQELVATGHITDDEARTHPRRNIVTRALGIDPAVRVDAWKVPIVRGDRFLLCSDGLVDEVRDSEIVEVLRTIGDPRTAADELVALANRQGGRDNITVVVVDVDEGADPPDPDTELDLEPAWQDGTGAGTWTVDDPEGTATEFADLAALVATETGADTPTGIATAIDTTATDASPSATDAVPSDASPPRRRKRRFGGFVIALAVLAVLLAGFVLAAAWARRSYFVAFDDAGVVVVYRGQNGGFLWFDPTEEARDAFTREQLDDDSIGRVEREPTFSSRSGAEDFVAEQLQATTTTTSTTTTTTTTTVPATTTTVAP